MVDLLSVSSGRLNLEAVIISSGAALQLQPRRPGVGRKLVEISTDGNDLQIWKSTDLRDSFSFYS